MRYAILGLLAVLAMLLSVAPFCNPAMAQNTVSEQCAIDKAVSSNDQTFAECPKSDLDGDILAAGFTGARLEKDVVTSKTPIWVHDSCRYLDARGLENPLFIPFKTKPEWDAFVTNLPSSVVATECCLPRAVSLADVPAPTVACEGGAWVLDGLVDPNDRSRLIAIAESASKDAAFKLVQGGIESTNYPVEKLPVAREDLGTVVPVSFTGQSDDGVYVARFTCKGGKVIQPDNNAIADIRGDASVFYSDFRLQCRDRAWRSEESCIDHEQRKQRACPAGQTGEIQVLKTERRCNGVVTSADEQVVLNTCATDEAKSDNQLTELSSPSVLPACVPGQVGDAFTQACADADMEGVITKKRVRVCPSGVPGGVVDEVQVSNSCACVPTKDLGDVTKACPTGQTGNIVVHQVRTCIDSKVKATYGRIPVGRKTTESRSVPTETSQVTDTCNCAIAETPVSNTCTTCTPSDVTSTKACSPGMTGQIIVHTKHICDGSNGGLGRNEVTEDNQCHGTCVPSEHFVDSACPAGQDGYIRTKTKHVCDACVCGDPGRDIVTVENHCRVSCTPSTNVTCDVCPAGQEGKITTTRSHICDGSNGGAGRDDVQVNNQCHATCVPGQVGNTYEEQCPTGQTGKITKRKVRVCPAGEEIVETIGNTCTATCIARDDHLVVYGREKKADEAWKENGLKMNTMLSSGGHQSSSSGGDDDDDKDGELVKVDILANDTLIGGGDIISFTQPVLNDRSDKDPGKLVYEGNGLFRYKESRGLEDKDKKWKKVGSFTYTIMGGCTATVYFQVTIQPSPLVLDLDGDGIELLSLAKSKAAFDMDLAENGKPDRTAWIGPRDAFLARDLNGNGLIDSRHEMFGDLDSYDNGFAHLATLDDDKDGQITAKDKGYATLLLWTDKDGDGVSSLDELKGIAASGIAAVSVTPRQTNKIIAGQRVTHESVFTLSDGTTRPILDIWFDVESGW